MEDLILSTKVEMLQEHVKRVSGLMAAAKKNIDLLQGLSSVLQECAGLLSSLDDHVEKLRKPSLMQEDMKAAEVTQVYDGARKSVKALFERVLEAKSQAENLHGLSLTSRIPQLPPGKNFVINLKKETDSCEISLRTIATKLAEEPFAEQALSEAWGTYGTDVHEKTQRVFTECVEFLSGLALRDAQLDAGICQLADEMMESDFNWIGERPTNLVTIPSRQQAVSMTIARAIRLGIPEWTIWALPLAAHEVWHVAAKSSTQAYATFTKAAEKLPLKDPWMQDCLADGFATLVMGPAYAYAAVLLRCNPCQAYTGDTVRAADNIRVETILAMLKRMSASDTDPYQEVIDSLSTAWKQALTASNLKGAAPAFQSEVNVGDVVEALWTSVGNPLSAQVWTTAQSWGSHLIDNTLDDIETPDAPGMRHLLNAAWYARTKYRNKTAEIQASIATLWARFKSKTDSRPGDKATFAGPGAGKRYSAAAVALEKK